ncbi:hypothetical protein HK101_004438, partial [Irineochytrium annulatum]
MAPVATLSIHPLPVPPSGSSCGGYITGHPGLRFRPCVVAGIVRIAFPANRSPRLETLTIQLNGAVTIPTLDPHRKQPTKRSRKKGEDEDEDDELELVALNKVLIGTEIPVKLSELNPVSTGATAGSNQGSSTSLNGPGASAPASPTASNQSHVDIKFKFELSAKEAANLPPSVLMDALGPVIVPSSFSLTPAGPTSTGQPVNGAETGPASNTPSHGHSRSASLTSLAAPTTSAATVTNPTHHFFGAPVTAEPATSTLFSSTLHPSLAAHRALLSHQSAKATHGVRYHLRAYARFTGTFENTEVEAK